MTRKIIALATIIAMLTACAGHPIHVRVSSDGAKLQQQKRGALGGIPGGGFIPPTKLSKGGGITNGAGANVIPKSDGANLVASSWTDNGTTTATTAVLDVNNDLLKVGAMIDGATYIKDSSINCEHATDSDGATCYISRYGYNGSTSRFRNTSFRDGKDGEILLLTGSSKLATFRGAVSVANTLTVTSSLIANATASVSSWLNADTVYSGSKGFACARATNGDATCHISAVAFNNNAGVTRNLQINDGLGSTLGTHSIAYFNGANHSTTLYGVAAVNKKSLLSALASPANTVLALEQTDGTDMHLHMRGTGNKYITFGNASNATDGYIWYSSSRNLLFGVLNAVRLVIDGAGPIRMGDGGGSTVPNNIDVLTIGNTGTGQTASGTALARLTHTGTFNAASDLEVDGLNVSVAATRASGSNMVRNRAIVADAADNPNALGAAITTLRGWNHFNTAGGASRFYGSLFADNHVVFGTDTTDTVTINGSINRVVHYQRADADLSCSSASCTITDYSGDARGRVTCSDVNSSGSCTITFGTPYETNPPACVLQLESLTEAHSPTISSISTSGFTFQFSISGPQSITYHCDGMIDPS